MLRRFKLIRNIGRFDSFTAGEDVVLAPLTLVYAENARGKTTLCAILRSLGSGDPMPIEERRRFRAAGAPHVVLELADKSAVVFENAQWSRILPNLFLFDDLFVHENVHSGLDVEPEHRSNLHTQIIGRRGVELARQFESLTTEIATLQADVVEKARTIRSEVPVGMSVDEFTALAPVPGIEAALLEAQRHLAALEEADAVRNTRTFQPLAFPAVRQDELSALLQTTLTELDARAVAATREHFAALGVGGEAWVSQGMSYATTNDCPFCGAGLAGSSLIEHYRAYFGQAYTEHKLRISELVGALRRDLGEAALLEFERTLQTVRQRYEFWRRFTALPAPGLEPAEQITLAWQQARTAAVGALERKLAAPLEAVVLSAEEAQRLAAIDVLSRRIAATSAALGQANPAIDKVKLDVAKGDLAAARSDVNRLKIVERRFTEEVAARCDAYVAATGVKEEREREKGRVKTLLDQHREKVVPEYQSAMNEFLRKVGADFRVPELKPTQPKGRPSTVYELEMLGERVPVGAERAPGLPTFRNTMSAGDRNSLALAFFFASVAQEQENQLASALVVIDDPISSLDAARTIVTAQEIRSLQGRAGQTIVLSHSPSLLCTIWENAEQDECAALEIRRSVGGSSTLQRWDIRSAAFSEHDQRHTMLAGFRDGEPHDLREVATQLRPHLEGYLRVACPALCPPGSTLNVVVTRARQAVQDGAPVLSPNQLTELDDLREYANRFHHDTNPAYYTSELARLNEAQLVAFVRRVLAFCTP